MSADLTDIKPIAFYLPQFYETPYNSEWWGEGFTEWTAARRGQAVFAGHKQPQLPLTGEGELGFHDQSELATLTAQAKLAKAHGIYGFCHYFYWFGGRRVLEKPTELMLANPSVDMPFCLSWANENWSRRWDGGEMDILIPQDYDPERYDEFAADLAPYFSDPRYITSGDKAVFLIYRPDEIPQLERLVSAVKASAKACGHGGALVLGTETFVTPGQQQDPRLIGLDGAVEFPPHGFAPRQIQLMTAQGEPPFEGMVFDHASAVSAALRRPSPDYPLYRGVFPAWDNSARRERRATIFAGSSPELFSHWLYIMSDWTQRHHPKAAQFIFINAWNEWAEGAHLEPDTELGRSYLETLKAVLAGQSVPEPSFDWARRTPEYIAEFSKRFEAQLGTQACLGHQELDQQAGTFPYQLMLSKETMLRRLVDTAREDKTSGDKAKSRRYIKPAQPWREQLRRARSFKDFKTALWMAGYHDYPQTRWQKLTTALISRLSKTG